MPTPPVKASTSTKSRSADLRAAMAAVIIAGKPGRDAMSNISTKLQKQTKEQHAKDMKKKK